MIIVKMQFLNKFAKMPTRGSEYAAGYDLYAATDSDIIIEPHKTVKVGTGIAMAIPEGYFGAVYARSGLATKKGLRPANKVGIIDADYRGEIIVALHNDTNEAQTVSAGDRIAQIIIQPYPQISFSPVEELSSTNKRKEWIWKHRSIKYE